MTYDIIIVGGGPAGLSFARALADAGLNIALVEQQDSDALADPGYDGREIALTHRSVRMLTELGAWARLPAEEISELREARVLNGLSPLALTFDTAGRPEQALGVLVSNHLIRRALFDAVQGQDGLTLMTGVKVADCKAGPEGAEIRLEDGRVLSARLLVAADSRFSSVRRRIGIGAEMNPTGKPMLVCRVSHDGTHDHVATEWFGRGQTFAMLPLNGRISSAVLTLPVDDARRLAALPDDAIGAELTARYRHRLGAMRVASSVHVYPLTMTFADRFAVPGAALVGDAAVGMHPVTAHGFNLGVAGACTLAAEIRQARRVGEDWASIAVLDRYARKHRRAALPLYRATNLIVGLYNDERPAALLARHAAIRLGRRLPFVRGAVRSMLLHA